MSPDVILGSAVIICPICSFIFVSFVISFCLAATFREVSCCPVDLKHPNNVNSCSVSELVGTLQMMAFILKVDYLVNYNKLKQQDSTSSCLLNLRS